MTRTISFLIFLLASFFAVSQTSDSVITNPDDGTIIMTNINDTTIYTTVDSVAVFPGGRPSWIKYVQKNLNPGVGIDNGAKKGSYNVIIKFIVTKDGTLKDFQPETKYGYGFEEEVIRILKLSPKWIPAKRNGASVNSIIKQNQLFIISEG